MRSMTMFAINVRRSLITICAQQLRMKRMFQWRIFMAVHTPYRFNIFLVRNIFGIKFRMAGNAHQFCMGGMLQRRSIDKKWNGFSVFLHCQRFIAMA